MSCNRFLHSAHRELLWLSGPLPILAGISGDPTKPFQAPLPLDIFLCILDQLQGDFESLISFSLVSPILHKRLTRTIEKLKVFYLSAFLLDIRSLECLSRTGRRLRSLVLPLLHKSHPNGLSRWPMVLKPSVGPRVSLLSREIAKCHIGRRRWGPSTEVDTMFVRRVKVVERRYQVRVFDEDGVHGRDYKYGCMYLYSVVLMGYWSKARLESHGLK